MCHRESGTAELYVLEDECRNAIGSICESGGTKTCNGMCNYEACIAPAESCNGADDDCDGACDEGCQQPVHRAWCPTTQYHLYTLSESEVPSTVCSIEVLNYFFRR